MQAPQCWVRCGLHVCGRWRVAAAVSVGARMVESPIGLAREDECLGVTSSILSVCLTPTWIRPAYQCGGGVAREQRSGPLLALL